ncbi:class I SAM-dependent methyltransferase [Streptomyces sp. MAR4 CNX-425]|uniref:class I SAM-dependent methyltransferase n=1 Tax=Streptomyces sp. MAR4 CNX-425 TaxID=3406343 RepID=UPI003B50C619
MAELTVTKAAVPQVGEGDRAGSRRTNFLYQDGVMLAASVRALDSLGLLDDPGTAGRLPDTGYLRVLWRCLAGAGWVDETPGRRTWTAAGRSALRHRARYAAAGRFLARFAGTLPASWSAPWDAATRAAFAAELDAHARWRAEAGSGHLVTTHLDGALAVPALLSLRGRGRLHRPDGDVARLLALLGWVDGSGGWTARGQAGLAFVDHLGLVGSYLPMLARLEQLCRGELVVSPGDVEWHCSRDLNVQASAVAHRRYFADADPVFREIFSRTPRPRFIADVGCGDGSWLAHLHGMFGDGIRYVGVDASPVALDYARGVLKDAGVHDPVLLVGDISDPDALAAELAAHGLAMRDGLHIRSFVDHDRTYHGDRPDDDVPGWATGAYVAPDGRPLSAAEVESDLVAHLRRWTPHVRDHGLVVLEAHCVAPGVARRHLGELHSVAFDAYHGLSHQYPLEHSAFMRCCSLAGLQPVSHLERRYPSNRPFVAVSLNRLLPTRPAPPVVRAARHDTWRPEPGCDLTDGEQLHRLLYTDGDLAHPRSWAAGATGIVVRDTLDVVESRIERAGRGDVIRVLDYGAGSGLAAIELSKACVAHHVEQRLADRGARFELHLVDLPTPWFAQGYELLRDVPWTRFHALVADDGTFRPLLEATGGRRADAVMANMVFHLLGPAAMGHAAASIADVLLPGGLLSFSAPDLAPTTPYSLLFHDPNRLLRKHWLDALDAPDPGALPPGLRAAVAAARRADRAAAQRRADRRILPVPRSAESVTAALAPYFDGALARRTFELLAEESLMTALVPANQAEYLAEIADRGLREAVIRHLMRERVLPELMGGSAGTALGLNIEWKLGRYTRCA